MSTTFPAPRVDRDAGASRSATPWSHRLRRVAVGADTDPRWVRPSLIGLLVVTAVLYLWDLGASGWANSFYSAAVQAGSVSWKAFFFGSSDAGNSITVDKPPASLWVMALSVRLFGLSSWAILVPQALMGVATVGLLYATVRRHFSAAAGLFAGALLALTPVAVLMFKFNNPDALLVLLLVGSVYAVLRAVEDGRTRWLVLAGVLVGFGFLTKQLQAFVVLPALGVTYLVAGPVGLGKRFVQLVAAALAVVVAGGWWVAAVTLWPASSRPYIGGSQDNSFLGLTFGYNGFGRLTGDETGSVVGGRTGGTGGGMWGATGLFRMFGSEFGGQISWLLPAALIALVAGLWATRRYARTSTTRASLVVWGLWLLVTGLMFSFMSGIIHPYYTVALAPAIAALVAGGSDLLWRRRDQWWAAVVLAAGVLVTAVWAFVLLDRSSTWLPWLRWLALLVGIGAAAAIIAARFVPARMRVATGVSALVAAIVAVMVGPAAYAVETATTAHTGSIPSAGPAVAGGNGFGGARGAGFNRGSFGRRGQVAPGGTAGGQGFPGGTQGGTGGQGVPGGTQGGTGGPGGTTGGQGGTTGGQGQMGGQGFPGGAGTQGGTGGQGFPGGTGTRGGTGGGMGGLLSGSTPSAALTAALEQDASSYTWVAATIGANNASGYQLATQDAVMPIGGFNGTDPSPTLAEFKQYVAQKKIHYFIAGGRGGGLGSSGSSSAITSWVEANFPSTTVGGTTLYDLTSTAGASSSSTASTDTGTT